MQDNRDARQRALGTAIRQRREAAGFTQRGLGDRLARATGEPTPQTTMSRWEAGVVDLGYERISMIERVLDLAPGTLGVDAQYVSPAAATARGFRTITFDTLDGAIDAVRSAEALGLGVHLSNDDRTHPDNPTRRGWLVVLSARPPAA